MECSASSGVLQRCHLMTNFASAGISRGRIGMRSKLCAVRRGGSIKASNQCQYAALPSSSWYDVLSVPQGVSARDLKSAYRRMALKYHPDVCPPAEKEECSRKFLQVQKAYETLSDPLLRQDYDWRLQNRLEFSGREERMESNNYVWEAQLMELIRRRSGYDDKSWSWGSRMRRRSAEQMATAAAGH